MGAAGSVASGGDDALSLQLAQEIVRDRERAERIWRAANQIAGVSGTLAREDGQKKVNSATANGAKGAVGSSGKWVATVDPDSGSTYYWNEATGETRWTDPAAPEAAAAAAAAPAAGKADATGTAAAAPALSDDELCRAVLAEINAARADPAAYAAKVEALYLPFFEGAGDDELCMRDPENEVPGAPLLRTQEGPRAVHECAAALRAFGGKAAAPPLAELSEPLSRAAAEHAADIGASGETSHDGADGSGPQDRIERHGEWQVTLGENLSFGCRGAARVVCQLLVDDGVASRGHRKNTLNPKFAVAGIAAAEHAKFGRCCVIDFVGGYGPKRQVSDQAATVETKGKLSAAFLAVMESVPAQIAEQLIPLCEQAVGTGETVTIIYDPNGEVQIKCRSEKQERTTQASWGVTPGAS